jgi:hypothetical protein
MKTLEVKNLFIGDKFTVDGRQLFNCLAITSDNKSEKLVVQGRPESGKGLMVEEEYTKADGTKAKVWKFYGEMRSVAPEAVV